MNSQVSESSFNFSDNCDHDFHFNQSINDTSLIFTLNQLNNLIDLFTNSTTFISPTFKKLTDHLLEFQTNLPLMDSETHETKFLSTNHLNTSIHSNNFLSDNSCSYDSLVESDDSLPHSYTFIDHSTNENQTLKPRFSDKIKISNHSENMINEEEEKKKLRRERNKLAAARCRKRRLDHTNNLLKQTEDLEEKNQLLENELLLLQQQKVDLEYCLQTHKAECKSLAFKQATFTLKSL